MKYKNKAVVLGTNYYIGLGVVRALGMEGIYVVSIDYEKSHYGRSKYVKEALIAPHYKKEEKELVKFLIDYAKKEEVKPVLYPTADLYVEFMENNFDELKEYYLWPNDKKGFYKKLMDKKSLLGFTEKYGIKTPEIIDLDEEDVIERVDREFSYPCIVKPRDSMPFVNKFRQKAFRCKNKDELTETIEKVKKSGLKAFAQRIIKGPESNCYSFDVYMGRDGEVKSFMTTSKIRQWPINFGASTYAKQEYISELYDICVPLFKGEKYRGFGEVELKRDEKSGEIYLIEINVRFVNFVFLQYAMGMKNPLYYYLDSIGEDFEGPKITENKEVYWKYKYEDIFAIRAYLKTGQMSLGKILKDYRLKKVSSTWHIKDPMPGIKFFLWAISHKITGAK